MSKKDAIERYKREGHRQLTSGKDVLFVSPTGTIQKLVPIDGDYVLERHKIPETAVSRDPRDHCPTRHDIFRVLTDEHIGGNDE